MNTTFVTAYINIYGTNHYDQKDPKWRFAQFDKLAKTGIPIVVFCDADNYTDLTEIVRHYPLICLMPPIALEDMAAYRTFTEANAELPAHRNVPKDTAKYIVLQHSKAEFVHRVAQQNPWSTRNFAWIDFNVFHIFSHPEHVKAMLHMIAASSSEPEIVFPGCKPHPIPARDFENLHYFDNICWRFCGGFFWGSADAVSQFAIMCQTHLFAFFRKFGKMPWEVNYWAYLEATIPEWPHTIYMADHNERILAVPQKLLTRFLAMKARSIPYECPTDYPYVSSSTSFLDVPGKGPIVNVRCVNYELSPTGYYWIRHKQGHICTENYMASVDENGPRDYVHMEDASNLPSRPGGKIYGLEDLRLYWSEKESTVKFVATSANYSPTDRSRIVVGYYDVDGARMHSCRVIEPPTDTWCEKNWIPLESDEIIYRWHPYEIGEIVNGRLQIVRRYDLGAVPFIERLRGSTIFQEIDRPYARGKLGVVHFSIDTEPRQYYHMMILLDMNNVPIRHSAIFSFRKTSIEFCIGFAMKDDVYSFFVSNFDRDSEMIQVRESDLPSLDFGIDAQTV